jgi:glycosyltransferase involved in cell wall biosynthesis
MPARVALITPFAFPSVRGNAITVERIARGLRGRGLDLRVWDLSVVPEPTVERQVRDFQPILVHAFHAFRVGPFALRIARRLELPLVVTITGTDANHDLFDPERAQAVRHALEGATAVTTFHASMSSRITRALPDLASRVTVVPQSPFFEESDVPGLSAVDGGRGPALLVPAGIRMVKNPRFPLAPLDALLPRYPDLALSYVGPILDANEGAALLDALGRRPWARYLGTAPHPRMRALYERADLVLNCSISEGGMANSVLEAMSLGRAVLASNIDGNRSLVEDGVTGFLFDTHDEFRDKADRLLGDPALRHRLGEAGRALVTSRFGVARELHGYLTVYARLSAALRNA